jgi:hypothetical protein
VIWLWWAPIHAARAARLRPRGSVVVRPADFTFPQLAAWPERATDEALGLHGVEFTDLDEARNRVVIGVSSRSARETAARVLRRHGVPESAVLIEETEPVVLHQSLRDRSRPLEGGFQIVSMVNLSPSICTYGVNAIQHGQPVALTAAHCVDPSRPQVYQPAFGEENLIGHAAAVSGNFSHVAVLRIHPSMQRNFGFIAHGLRDRRGQGRLDHGRSLPAAHADHRRAAVFDARREARQDRADHRLDVRQRQRHLRGHLDSAGPDRPLPGPDRQHARRGRRQRRTGLSLAGQHRDAGRVLLGTGGDPGRDEQDA